MIKGDNFVFRQNKRGKRKRADKPSPPIELTYRSEEYSICVTIKRVDNARSN